MADTLRISMIQAPIAWEDREGNLAAFGKRLARVSGKTDLVVLPETFSTGFSMNVEQQCDSMDGATVARLKDWAGRYRTAISGSFIAKVGGDYFNRAFFITAEGEAHYYDKRHLFRMAGEAERFSAGTRQLVVPYRGWNICLQVCYDLRFPVWSRNVANRYDLLLYVANWPESRQQVWQALLPARAIENQAYVCGVNCTGSDGQGIRYRGGSAVWTPKGQLLAGAGSRETLTRSCTLQKDKLEALRTKFPAWKDADHFIITP